MPILSGGGGTGLPVGGAATQVVGWGGSSGTGTWVVPPGTELGYDQITANVSVVSTTEATGTTIITCGAHTFDGTPVIAHFFASAVSSPTNPSTFTVVSLFEGATQIGRLCTVLTGATPATQAPGVGFLRFTPTAASHTYTVTAFASAGTGGVTAGAGGTGTAVPAFIRFTKA